MGQNLSAPFSELPEINKKFPFQDFTPMVFSAIITIFNLEEAEGYDR